MNNKEYVKSERLEAFPTYEGCVVYQQVYHVQFLVAVVSTPLFFCSEDRFDNGCTI